MKILVVNCGSSSIKYQLYEMPHRTVLARGVAERIGEEDALLHIEVGPHRQRQERAIPDHEEGMRLILKNLVSGEEHPLDALSQIAAVGHRVVHGGESFTGSVIIDEAVLATIGQCSDLAPLHNPANLTGIGAAMHALPDVPQVACFDTAFHATIPPVAYRYALPENVYSDYGVRRYGFHGTSHRYVAERTAALLEQDLDETSCITIHLGNGCSMSAIQNGRVIDTSMGLTPLEGLVMGTRSGDIDPAILFYLHDKGYDIEALNTLCNKKSGLLGVSGISNDMRTLFEHAAEGNARARLAIDIFCYRVRKYMGSYLAVLGRADAISFTGGIGERSVEVRRQVCEGLESLGIAFDVAANASLSGTEGRFSAMDSRVKLLVVPTDEEVVIAADTFELVNEGANCDTLN